MERSAQLSGFVSRIEMARRERQDLSARVVDTTGVTLNQALVLSEVQHENGQATVSSLAKTLGRAVHTLTSAISGLERKGLVARTRMKGEDRRIVRLVITGQGGAALERFRCAAADLLAGVDCERLNQEPPEDVRRSVGAVLRLLEGPR